MADEMTGDPGASTVARDSMTIGIWAVATRVTGLARLVATGAILGPTFLTNIYQSTNVVPNLLNELLAGPLIAAVLVPPLVRYFEKHQDAEARRFANAALGLVLATFAVTIVLALVGGPLFVRLLTLGVGDELSSDARRVAWVLLLLMLPQALLYGTIAVAMAAQQARGRFAIPAAAPLVENLGIVITLLAVIRFHGTGFEVDEADTGLLLLLGGGTTLSVAAHALVQWVGAQRAGLPLWPTVHWRDPEIRSVIRLAIPSIGSASIGILLVWSGIIVAGIVPGGVVAFQTGVMFATLPSALITRPISTALLPRLARLRMGDPARLFEEYRTALGVVLFMAFPAALGLVAISGVLAKGMAFGSMATPDGVELLRLGIAGAALRVVPGAVFEVAWQVAYSARDARSTFEATIIRAIAIIPGLAIAAWVGGATMILILGLNSGIADSAASGYLDRRVRAAAAPSRTLRKWLPRQLVGAIIAGVAAWAVATGLDSLVDSRLGAWLAIAAGGGAGLLAYVAVQLPSGLHELDAFGVRIPQRLRALAGR
ncbi:MAG: oligosaccharide flippase family protein [Chloroflexi bacterium]|nr:oligosaccharide flippase family protein [Chloroflexota bacterium]MDA1146886.1 oligosaccharide flippase family protein [Chloroflexota bacterium]